MEESTYFGYEPRHKQGITTDFKKIVIDTHLLSSQYLTPESRQLLLGLCSRRNPLMLLPR
jgi:hypothetical protein